MNVLGGAGTSCAAFATKKYPPFRALIDYAWLYQGFVVVTVALGLGGLWVTYKLVRGERTSYRNALIVLGAGSVVGAAHMIASLTLRGKAVPANVKLYANLLTLAYFLLMGLPGLRDRVRFTEPGDRSGRSTAAGLAAVLAGALTLSTPMWAGPSHTFDGVNLTMTFPLPLALTGLGLSLLGLVLLSRAASAPRSRRPGAARVEPTGSLLPE
jgi:hypothetical protein